MFQKLSIFFAIVFILTPSIGLEYNKQRYTQNTDFLLHEAGVPNGQKKDNAVPPSNENVKPSFDISKTDFPSLGPPSSSHTTKPPQITRVTQSSGKRDYVAPNYPPLPSPGNTQLNQNSQSSGKRDYVATGFPTLRPPAKSQQGYTNSLSTPKPMQSGGRRDYVNPNLPSSSTPSNPQQGKVKDLVNFFDNKGPSNDPQKTPSYSSIAQGANKNNQGFSSNQPFTPTVKPPTSQTLKPLSFSTVVSGSNHNTAMSTGTTVKPSSVRPSTPTRHTSPTNYGTRRPLVPPSSIANNNRNNQGNDRNSVSETELQTLSEELLRKDINNAAKYITTNYQEKTTSQSLEDKAPLPLLTVSQEAWNLPTIQKFLPLLDNYERDTLVNEYVTPQERNEENAFMDAIMSTTVIRHLMNFLKDKGFVTPDPKQQRDFLKQLWFSLYSRGKGKISSSGFEHSFVSELKNGEVSGLHNWIYFSREEQANRLNYLGYLKYEELNGKGAVVKLHFNQQGVDKPVDTMFIGTSPELEIALYTLCFVTRADNDCRLKLANKDINIVTYNFRYRSKNLIGSAYPQI